MGKHSPDAIPAEQQLSAFVVAGPRGADTPPASGGTSLETLISQEVNAVLVKMLDELAGHNPETVLGDMRLWADDYMQQNFGRGLNE